MSLFFNLRLSGFIGVREYFFAKFLELRFTTDAAAFFACILIKHINNYITLADSFVKEFFVDLSHGYIGSFKIEGRLSKIVINQIINSLSQLINIHFCLFNLSWELFWSECIYVISISWFVLNFSNQKVFRLCKLDDRPLLAVVISFL